MKRSLIYTFITIALIGFTMFSSAAPAFAQATTTPSKGKAPTVCISFTQFNPTACVNILTANIVNLFMSSAAFGLGIAGEILNVSIVLTLHIKDFIQSTPAVYTVWQTIRDISGLFFVFFLLYAAIQMILGEEAKFGHTIKNIVITGILINFSFFIVSLGIDASNVVSLAIYNQMLPNTNITTIQPAQNGQNGSSLPSIVKEVQGKGGISDIFMNSLKVSKLYDPKANDGAGGVTGGLVLGPLKIVLIGMTGVIMMWSTTMSFLIASAAFAIRLAVLIFILAFSPLLFLSWMSPELKEQSDRVLKVLKSQLIFMPVYLLLTYVALSILNNSNLVGAATTQSSDFLPTGTNWTLPFITLAINFVLVIFMLNLPLVVGISMSGHMGNAIKKFNAKNIWKSFGTWTGRNTAGRLASRVNESETMRNLYSKSPTVGRLVSNNLSKVSSAGFGGGKNAGFDQVRKKQIESRKKFVEGLGFDERAVNSGVNDLKAQIAEKRTKFERAQRLIDSGASDRATSGVKKIRDKNLQELNELLGTDLSPDDAMNAEKLNKSVDTATKNKETILKEQRKTTATKIYSESRSIPAEFLRKVSGNRFFVDKEGKPKPNKFYKGVTRAIQKKKSDAEKLIDEAMSALKKEKGGGEEGGDKDKDKKEEK